MKFNFRKSFLAQLLIVVAIIGLFAPLVPQAKAQTSPKEFRQFTNIVTAVAASSVTNIACILPLRNGKNHFFYTAFNTSGSGTDNVQYWLTQVPDGTNAITTGTLPVILSVAANGTTAVYTGTNIMASTWDGVSGVRCSISNASGTRTVYVTNTFLINSR